MGQGCILIQHISNVIREAYIEELGFKTGENLVYNLRNADDIALYTAARKIVLNDYSERLTRYDKQDYTDIKM